MSEVKTEPLEATPVANEDGLWDDAAKAGSFWISEEAGTLRFISLCPCGCGCMTNLRIGRNDKPSNVSEPTWRWNGDSQKPTLEPSINHIGHWHGYLTDGVWRSC